MEGKRTSNSKKEDSETGLGTTKAATAKSLIAKGPINLVAPPTKSEKLMSMVTPQPGISNTPTKTEEDESKMLGPGGSRPLVSGHGTRPSALTFPNLTLYTNLQSRLKTLFRILDSVFAVMFSMVTPPWIYVWLAAYFINNPAS